LAGVRCTAPKGLAEWRYHGRLVARQLDDVHLVIRAALAARARRLLGGTAGHHHSSARDRGAAVKKPPSGYRRDSSGRAQQTDRHARHTLDRVRWVIDRGARNQWGGSLFVAKSKGKEIPLLAIFTI